MSPKGIVVLLSIAQAIAWSGARREIREIREHWSLAPIKTYSIVPIALSSNGRTIAELYENATFNDADNVGAHLLANLTSYGVDGRLLGGCCHLPLVGAHEYLADRRVQLASVAEDTEVVVWFVGSLKSTALRMSVAVIDKDRCEILARARLPFTGSPDADHSARPRFQSVRVVGSVEGFGLVVPARQLCDAELCSIEYARSTRRFAPATPLLRDVALEEPWRMLPTAHDPSSKGYFVALRSRTSLLLISDGKQATLRPVSPDPAESSLEASSAFNRLFSYCAALGNRVHCLQLDPELRVRLNVTVRFAPAYSPTRIAVLSGVPDASLLLVTADASGLARVARIDETRVDLDVLAVKLGCADPLHLHVYPEADGRACLQYLCKRRDRHAKDFYDNVMHVACF